MNSVHRKTITESSLKEVKPKLSIIVPVYNVEAYLSACLDSILQQTFTDFELILIDDGSPDKCGEMCDEYAKKDDRIIVIHKENGGLSSARNAGLDIAKGDYITFIDSDDDYGTSTTIEENMQLLLEDTSIDIVQFPIAYIDLNGNIVIKHNPEEKIFISNEEEYLRLLSTYIVTHTVWNKIYKRTVFDIHRFPIGKIHEDFFLHLDISDKKYKMVLSNRSFYNYYERKGSIMQSKRSRSKILNHLETEIVICHKLADFPSLCHLFIFRYSNNIYNISCFKKEHNISEIISVFHRIRPSYRCMFMSFFVHKPRHLIRHVARIVLFSMFKYTDY